eukprot:gene13030-27496_t
MTLLKLLYFVCAFHTGVFALSGADFELFPVPEPSVSSEGKFSVIKTVARITNAVSLGGGIYCGMQIARVLTRLARRKNQDLHAPSNSTSFEELQLDQQELWRVVHKLYTTQSDKISAVSNSSIDMQESIKADLAELKVFVEDNFNSISNRLEYLEQYKNNLTNRDDNNQNDVASRFAELESKLTNDILDLASLVQKLQKDIPVMIKQQHEVIMKKIREYIENLKSKKSKGN